VSGSSIGVGGASVVVLVTRNGKVFSMKTTCLEVYRAGVELVCRGSRHVGVAQAAKDSQLVLSGRCAEEEMMRCRRVGGVAGAPVDQVCRRVQGLCPEH
jgi:hypothetical protein